MNKDIWKGIPYAVPLDETTELEADRKIIREWRQKSIEDESQNPLKAFVESHLAQLSPEDRELFESKAIYNLDDKVISAQRGVSENKIRKDYEQIRERLKRDMSTGIKKLSALGIRISEEISEVKIMNVKQLRELTGLNEKQFAIRANMNYGYLRQIVGGTRKPSKKIVSQAHEATLRELVYQSRLALSTTQRLDESLELYRTLSRVFQVDKLLKPQMLVLDIDKRDAIPVSWNAFLALYLWNERLNRGLLTDLVLLDSYNLEDVIEAKSRNEPIKPTQETEILKYVEPE